MIRVFALWTPLVPVVAFAIACEGRHTDLHDEAIEASYELPSDASHLRIDVLDGSVTVQPADGGEVSVEAHTRRAATSASGLAALMAVDLRPSLRQLEEPGHWLLEGPRLPAGHAAPAHRIVLRAIVRVPPSVAVDVRTGFGHVGAHKRNAAVRLETGHGDVRVTHCTGDAVVRTGFGAVLVDRHRGALDVEVTRQAGRSADAPPLLEPADAQPRKTKTMQVFVDQIGDAGIRLVTPFGGIQCHVPTTAGFELDARTGAGRAKNSFDLPTEQLPGVDYGRVMRGAVNGGGPPVVIDARAGNISIRGFEPKARR